ncbi:MAG: hydrogenase expression/formation protein [Chloroflexi bacterium HGW-Chloroflexi-3]|nr:MAG: hydrogenase expression/formation protein [Chloroflexi bacterium HGW-Chloroflexi-3]
MKKTLILGVGNYLMSDDGLSVHVLEHLQANNLIPGNIQMIDGGTCGLDLLQYLEGVSNLIIIDAIKTRDGIPGSIIRLDGDQIPAYLSLKISPHDIGLPDLLATAKLRDLYPEKIVVFGIQPATLELGVELSPEVASKMDELIELIQKEVNEIILI